MDSGSGDESEPCLAAPTAKHAPDVGRQPIRQHKGNTAKQGEAAKGQDQQASRGRKRPEGMMVEETLADDDDVPSTYNNMPPRRQQQPQHAIHADHNAAPWEEEALKAKKRKSQKPQQKQEVPDQVAGAELEFDASDAESDEYEPTQAKAAAKRAGQKAVLLKGPAGKSQRPQQDHQKGDAKPPRKAAKHATEEGQAKRPRGRPRKAPPQQEQQPPPARKRKAVTAIGEEHPDEDPGGKAVAKPKKGKASRLRKIALMPDAGEAEGQDAQVGPKCCQTLHAAIWLLHHRGVLTWLVAQPSTVQHSIAQHSRARHRLGVGWGLLWVSHQGCPGPHRGAARE